MKQLLIYANPKTSGFIDFSRIDRLLEEGWRVKEIIPQKVSTGSASPAYGGFAILLEKDE